MMANMFGFIRRILGFDPQIGILSADEIEALGTPRSPKWKRLRDDHIRRNPACIVCGNTKNIVPHHIVPVHQNPERELDPENLVSLCEGDTFNCHLFFGHLRNWSKHNPNVVEDARVWREKTRKH
jgi:hypothetical protein